MRRRLLLLIHSLSMGGAERVAVNLANFWVAKGYEVGVATLVSAEADFYALDARVERIDLHVARPSRNVADAVVNNLRILHALHGLLRRWRPDVTIALMTTANVYLGLAGIGYSGKKIGSEHTHPPMRPSRRVWKWLRRLTYGRLDVVVALTETSAEWLRQHTSAKNVAVIPNPIPWPLPVQASILEPATVLRPGRRYVLGVGRLVDEKGFDRLIDAFARVAVAMPEWDLVIVGDGPLRESLERLIEERGLQDRARIVGKVGNVGDWYAACDLYVMSSRYEGFGNTLAEAMTYGLPAVAFDCEAGPRDIIRHGIDGFLVPDGDVDALAKAMYRVVVDNDLRQRLSGKALEARERFSSERIAGLWEGIFER